MFERTLSEIKIDNSSLQMLKELNSKYRYRFCIMHKRKLEDYNDRNSLSRMTLMSSNGSSPEKNVETENKSEKKRILLEEKLKEVEQNTSSQKIVLNNLEKLIVEKYECQ